MILFASPRMREPSILAREKWKIVPWADSLDKIGEQDFFNTMADCTVLVAEYDKITASGAQNIEGITYQRYQLAQRAQYLLEKLHSWQRQWDVQSQNTHLEDG